jgi:ankyrin repeat protein
MEQKKYENLIVHSWDIQKVSQLLMEKVPFEELIFDKTDILLETILRNEFILYKRILSRGFDINKSKFNYLLPILINYNEDKKKYIDLLFQYVDPKEYVNKKGGITKENALSVVTQQKYQDVILRISKLGADWNDGNILNQTPLHFLLRYNNEFSSELIEELSTKELNLDKKDDFGINAKDIIKNCLLVPAWLTENNKKLLKAIKYEDRR